MSKVEITQEKIYLVIAFVFSLIGSILVLVADFAYGYRYGYYVESWFWINSGTAIYGAIVILMGILLLTSSIISILGFVKPEIIPKIVVLIGMILALVVVIISALGIGVIAIEFGDYDWGPEAGFYGAIIGGILTALFLFLAWREK